MHSRPPKEKVPAGHGEQPDAEARDQDPAGHGVQIESPPKEEEEEYVPSGQAVQAGRSRDSAKPGGQEWQADAPIDDAWPAGQRSHVAAPAVDERVPAPHGWQTAQPAYALQKEPAGQGTH